ncbi:protein mesh-like [Ischnura elegans]|uniref:protein mesh-like n=1 Tax=Ischnura elegans TaxID=197161 RepID=UPI001ED86A39|nr:protein mesh-like [Ischnura elegans]
MSFRVGFTSSVLLLALLAVVTAEVQTTSSPKVVVKDYSHSRIAPPSHGSTSLKGAYELSKERLDDICNDLMYWYFDEGGDGNNGDYQTSIHSTSPQSHKNLTFELPFFGVKYNYTRVNLGGFLEFSDPPEHYTHPLKFPNPEYPEKNDPSFIGIFYSKCRIGNDGSSVDKKEPGVYYRVESNLQNRTDQFGVELRERVRQDIRAGNEGAENFAPEHVIIVTWRNVSFAGGIEAALNKTNTFQVVLVTDEEAAYAIFNYDLITWTTHTEAGGDTSTGLGGYPAFVGFNAGNGNGSFEYMPYSQTPNIWNLTTNGCGDGFSGRHIFRIDEKITLGICP